MQENRKCSQRKINYNNNNNNNNNNDNNNKRTCQFVDIIVPEDHRVKTV